MTETRTRLRWILASIIGLVSVWQALRTLPSLSSHAPLGAAALLALAVLTVLGLASLWQARRRVDRELVGLSQHPSTGTLVTARRARLAEIAARGGVADRVALAEAAASVERGQAYLGRYLVAVAVLIGLIGTFSGLAEALRALPSILGGAALDPQKLASLLGAPLAGLDVTFAAGIVGILSTLALALAQGDLQLAEDAMLARLEEETTHELIPALWPQSHSVEERMLRELAALREENRALLVEMGAAVGLRVAEVTVKTTTELATRLGSVVEVSTQQLADEVARGFAAAMKAHTEVAAQLRTEGAAQLATLQKSGETLVSLAAQSASALETKLASEAGQIASALDRSHAVHEALAEALRTSAAESVVRVDERLETLSAVLMGQASQTQRTLVESVADSGRVAAEAVEALRASIAQGLEAERSALVHELSVTRAELGTAIGAASDVLRGESSAARLALDESTAQALASMTESHALLTSSVTTVQQSMVDALLQATLAMADGASESKLAMTDAATQATTVIADGISRAERALSEGAVLLSTAAGEELSATRAAIVEATHGAHEVLGNAVDTALVRLEGLLTTSREAVAETLSAGREAVDRLVAESIGALSSSAVTLAESAGVLARTGDTLAPQLESLTPELRALSQEVALLGSRTDKTDEPLFADELVRIGEGMERLEALARLAQGHGESAQG